MGADGIMTWLLQPVAEGTVCFFLGYLAAVVTWDAAPEPVGGDDEATGIGAATEVRS